MIFIFGTKLAVLQDQLYKKYLKGDRPTDSEWEQLSKNMWVPMARCLAPGNLSIRNYCLVDLFNRRLDHLTQVINIFERVARYNEDLLWAEGYSYWVYTKNFLISYAKKFNLAILSYEIARIDQNFSKTAYEYNGLLYPAPFGDLRDQPLEQNLQNTTPCCQQIILANVQKEKHSDGVISYHIKPVHLGFNVHAPKKEAVYKVLDGVVLNSDGSPYEFYRGYDKKYPNKFAEITDFIDPHRWL